MTLFQDTGGDPRAAAARLADVLVWFGAVGDAVCGNPKAFALRKAAVAVALADIAHIPSDERNAIAFAGVLHAVGAIGNAAYRKGERLPARLEKMESWDVPPMGARICESIAALPAGTADVVRWQSERWDGTGYPDQLRWHSIPPAAQCLAVADAFIRSTDIDEALATVGLESGRSFGPDAARTFTMWFHASSGEEPPLELPIEALQAKDADAVVLLDAVADRIDEHNGVPGRWRRIAAFAESAAALLGVSESERSVLALAARLYGTGEVVAEQLEDAQFDPLARLGIEDRSRNATAAAAFVNDNGSLGEAAAILRARSEWFDGTGKPRGLKHREIPVASAILSATIAYDTLCEGHRSMLRDEHGSPAARIDTAVGTQFDPKIARALLEAVRTHA